MQSALNDDVIKRISNFASRDGFIKTPSIASEIFARLAGIKNIPVQENTIARLPNFVRPFKSSVLLSDLVEDALKFWSAIMIAEQVNDFAV